MCKCCNEKGQDRDKISETITRILLQELGVEGNRSFNMHLCGFIAERNNSLNIGMSRTEEGEAIANEASRLYDDLKALDHELASREEEVRYKELAFYTEHEYVLGVIDGLRLAIRFGLLAG